MAINFDPLSQFNFEPSSFSLPAGMDMNQGAIMNAMMQPVPILGQQGVSAPQSAPQPAPSSNFNQENLLSGLASLGAALNESKSPPASVSLTNVNEPQGGFFNPGGFGYENLGPRLVNTLGNFGERFGQFAGEQLYGTGITAEGQATGFPIDRPSVVGDIATLPGNTLRALDFFAGPVFDAIPDVADYVTGQSGVEFQKQERKNQEDIKNAVLDAQSTQELSRLMKQAEPNSPQANFLEAKAKGDLTSEQINQANAFAASMGTSFDPNLGYSRTPFLESREFETPTINSILNLPAGVGNFGMKTDAQGRMISQGDDRTSFDQASRDRLARLEQRDVRPGETITERDTRLAGSRTEGSDRGGEMTFEEARKFVPKGQKETAKAYNQRIKAYQAQQNSSINQLKEQYEEYRIQGQRVNNERTLALIANYQQTEPEKYREVFATAQEMLQDGILKDNVQVAMYIVSQMKGNVSAIFDPATQFMGGDDGVANVNQPNVTEEEYNKLKSGDSYFHKGQSYIKQ
tara:strand:+ start:5168 stop:6721 length:1554 start_codon:yes stop_codon:yes gene_type:complete